MKKKMFMCENGFGKCILKTLRLLIKAKFLSVRYSKKYCRIFQIFFIFMKNKFLLQKIAKKNIIGSLVKNTCNY